MANLYAQNPFLILLVLWELPWKGYALWKAAKQGDKVWYIILLIISTGALLEILYIFFFSKKEFKDRVARLFKKS